MTYCKHCDAPFQSIRGSRYCRHECLIASRRERNNASTYRRKNRAPDLTPLPDDKAAALIENVTDLLDFGEHPDRIARRLGVKYTSLITRLQRAGRSDLADRITAITLREADELRAYWQTGVAS